MTLTNVKAHTRGKPDPLAPIIEARRPLYLAKWGIEVVGHDDNRLSVPVAEPVTGPGRVSLSEIAAQLMALAKSVGWKG